MTNSSLPNTAIFIDGDWFHHAARRLKKEIDYAQLWSMLHNYFGPNVPIYFYGTIDPQRRQQIRFINALKKTGYIVKVTHLKRRKEHIIKKNSDTLLVADALSLPEEIGKIVLISGDSDFVPLLEQIRKNKKSSILITVPLIARSLIQAVDRFINLDTFLANLPLSKGAPKIEGEKADLTPSKSWYIKKGEHFAPYLTIRKLFTSAKKEIILVDPYIDDQILHMVKLVSTNINIKIITNNISPADFCIQVKKLKNEGYNIQIYKTTTFHDRFLGIDNNWWHSGHSFKDLGGKDSFLSRITDKISLVKLIERVENEINNTKERYI